MYSCFCVHNWFLIGFGLKEFREIYNQETTKTEVKIYNGHSFNISHEYTLQFLLVIEFNGWRFLLHCIIIRTYSPSIHFNRIEEACARYFITNMTDRKFSVKIIKGIDVTIGFVCTLYVYGTRITKYKE